MEESIFVCVAVGPIEARSIVLASIDGVMQLNWLGCYARLKEQAVSVN